MTATGLSQYKRYKSSVGFLITSALGGLPGTVVSTPTTTLGRQGATRLMTKETDDPAPEPEVTANVASCVIRVSDLD